MTTLPSGVRARMARLDDDRAARNFPCPACRMEPGDPCVSVTGRAQRVRTHADRARAWHAWRDAHTPREDTP